MTTPAATATRPPLRAPALPDPWPPGQLALIWLAAILAMGAPSLLAHNLPPSATLLNQCVAVASWGGLVLVLAPAWRPQGTGPLLAALGLLAAAVAWSWGPGALPASLALSALGLLAAAAVLLLTGSAMARHPRAVDLFAALAGGLLVTGALSALVAVVQVFVPDWTDGVWLATSGLPGRAVGNLRQPNHLCSLLLWAVIAAVALHELKRLPTATTAALLAVLVFAVELSASRTGAVGLVLLVGWALLDKRLSRRGRWLLLATPLLYALSYGAMAWYGEFSNQALGAGARLAADAAGAASPNGRPNVWRTVLAMVAQQPLWGVGFGEFNFAWSLTPFPGRPTAFFDHTHNLELQLLVELGLPLTLAVLALLGWALWRGARAAWPAGGEAGIAARAALLVVLMIGLHSQVEYPLWYAYFLLPTALVWGVLLGHAAQRAPGAAAASVPTAAVLGHPLGLLAGLALVLGGAAAVVDYQRVVVIYAPPEGAGALDQRIAAGQRSVLFAHHADYAAATTEGAMGPAARALAFQRAPHQLLDTRLMVAWARWLNAQGQPVLARTLAARVAEFGYADGQAFLDECSAPAAGATPFQCSPLPQPAPWRAFLAPLPAPR